MKDFHGRRVVSVRTDTLVNLKGEDVTITYYRGVGIGTYHYNPVNEPQRLGFSPHAPGMPRGINRIMAHVVYGTTYSPYVSLTRSYGVAFAYALEHSRTPPMSSNPIYVYEIELNDPLPAGLALIDPVHEIICSAMPALCAALYHHDGDPEFLLGVASTRNTPTLLPYLTAPYRQPPPRGGAARGANLTGELEAVTRALRDAEVLAVGTIPSNCVTNRYLDWP